MGVMSRFHSAGSLGSNTTHCAKRSTLLRTRMKVRRTLIWLNAWSDDSVRAPQMRIPRPGNVTSVLTRWSKAQSRSRLRMRWATSTSPCNG